ncbi:MAG: PDZ domain-containing protein [Gammaproteobacteria bacterium]|nr:PDZ domain-containing protein [Gammaproteobacteria bacterium]
MMKQFMLSLLLLAPFGAIAQDEDVSERLRDAELRLEQAAQEIAELAGESAKHVFKTMRHMGGDPNRAMLGINVGRIEIVTDDGTTDQTGYVDDGVEILAVTPGGPAAAAGLQSGDVVLALNGASLTGSDRPAERRLVELMESVEPGEIVSVDFRRGDNAQSVQVTTKAFDHADFAFDGKENFKFEFDGDGPHAMKDVFHHFPGFAHLGRKGPWRGLELVPLTPKLGRYFDTDSGLLVVRAPANNDISLEEGDVILNIAGATPASPPEAMRLLRFYQPGDQVEIDIRRQKRNRTLRITIPAPQSD